MIRTLRESPEVGAGTCTHVDVAAAAGRAGAPGRRRRPGRCCSCTTSAPSDGDGRPQRSLAPRPTIPNDVFADQDYPEPGDFGRCELGRLRLPLDPPAPHEHLGAADLPRGDGAAEVPALAQVAAEGGEAGGLVGRLDALGGDGHLRACAPAG